MLRQQGFCDSQTRRSTGCLLFGNPSLCIEIVGNTKKVATGASEKGKSSDIRKNCQMERSVGLLSQPLDEIASKAFIRIGISGRRACAGGGMSSRAAADGHLRAIIRLREWEGQGVVRALGAVAYPGHVSAEVVLEPAQLLTEVFDEFCGDQGVSALRSVPAQSVATLEPFPADMTRSLIASSTLYHGAYIFDRSRKSHRVGVAS